MNWPLSGFSGNITPEWDICEHLKEAMVAPYWVGEQDSFGPVSRIGMCEECYLAHKKVEEEELEQCYDCGIVYPMKKLYQWAPWDFRPSEGGDPIYVCETCRTHDKHVDRVARDRRDCEDELDYIEQMDREDYHDDYDEDELYPDDELGDLDNVTQIYIPVSDEVFDSATGVTNLLDTIDDSNITIKLHSSFDDDLYLSLHVVCEDELYPAALAIAVRDERMAIHLDSALLELLELYYGMDEDLLSVVLASELMAVLHRMFNGTDTLPLSKVDELSTILEINPVE